MTTAEIEALATTGLILYGLRRLRRRRRSHMRIFRRMFRRHARRIARRQKVRRVVTGRRRRATRGEVAWRAAYGAYIDSNVWRTKRLRVLARDGYRCRGCGWGSYNVRGHLHGHHTFYTNPIGDEPLKSIVTLCVPCHNKIHTLQRANPNKLTIATATERILANR